MPSAIVLTADHHGVRVITLNRPSARNALSRDLIRAAYAALTDADADESVRAVVLTGGGMTARLPQLVGVAMARRLSMTGEVVDAGRAERIGLVTEVVPHERLLEHAVDLAAQIADVPRPTMRSLKEIYTTGAAAVTDPALAAEERIAFAAHRDFDGLRDRFSAVAARNKEQITPS